MPGLTTGSMAIPARSLRFHAPHPERPRAASVDLVPQPGRINGMKIMIAALALGAVAALSVTAQAEPRARRVMTSEMRAPVVRSDPFWIPDYISVPRYRYRPEDDRVDTSPYAKPVAPGDVEPGGFGIGQ
jgi:hypothetical protein